MWVKNCDFEKESLCTFNSSLLLDLLMPPKAAIISEPLNPSEAPLLWDAQQASVGGFKAVLEDK